MSTEPLEPDTAAEEGPANGAADPLGPSAPQPAPTGEPRRPGSAPHSAENIRDDQGTHAAGAVPASPGQDADAADRPGDGG